jgi:hypothetical protein
MTQKSLARQQRDQVAKDAQKNGVRSLYSVLEDMHSQQRGMFGEYAKMIQMISHEEISPFLKDPVRVDILLKGMSADIDELLGKTEQLYEGHRGKAGWPDPKDEDVHYNLMQMQQQYIVYLNVHQQNILPVMFELDEHLNYAIRNKQNIQMAAVAAATAQNAEPNIVTGMTVSADGQNWTTPDMSQAPAADPYETPAI